MSNEIKNLMFDAAARKKIYDAETESVISPEEASDTIMQYCLKELGLNEKSSARDIKRALNKEAGKKLFEMIEEVIDVQVSTGWQDNEFFNEFVEEKNLADGDDNEFYSEDDVILTVTKVAGDHHDLITQKLGAGESITIPTSVYAIKVGTDIRLFLTGRKDWADFIDAVTRAFVKKVQNEMYTTVMGASAKMPAQFTKTGTLSDATKATFDQLIEDVSMANDGAEVVIMGTKTALKKINGLASVDWISYSQKEAVAASGILGTYEGTTLLEIPQRFADNDVATKLVDNTALLIMPIVDNKFVKFVDYGETSLEVTEAGDTMNDQQSYEVQRRMGVGTVISRYFGKWTLA